MAFFINNFNQKIAYKYTKGGNPGIIFVHGLNSDMEGLKAITIEKYAKKNKLSFLRFDCRGHGKSYGKFENYCISEYFIQAKQAPPSCSMREDSDSDFFLLIRTEYETNKNNISLTITVLFRNIWSAERQRSRPS